MGYRNERPARAKELCAEDALIVDVRSEQEFEAEHAPGAYNVPLMFRTPAGMEPNPEFVAAMERAFAKDKPLVLV